EVLPFRAIGAWIGRNIQRAAIFHWLVVEINLLQLLEAAALVHKGNAAVIRSDIVRRESRIAARTGGKIERRHAGGTAHSCAGRSTAINVLFVSQFVVVVRSIIALPCEKWLQTLLAAAVHRKKLFAILPRKIVEQL